MVHVPGRALPTYAQDMNICVQVNHLFRRCMSFVVPVYVFRCTCEAVHETVLARYVSPWASAQGPVKGPKEDTK